MVKTFTRPTEDPGSILHEFKVHYIIVTKQWHNKNKVYCWKYNMFVLSSVFSIPVCVIAFCMSPSSSDMSALWECTELRLMVSDYDVTNIWCHCLVTWLHLSIHSHLDVIFIDKSTYPCIWYFPSWIFRDYSDEGFTVDRNGWYFANVWAVARSLAPVYI